MSYSGFARGLVAWALIASPLSADEVEWPHFAHPDWSPVDDRIAIDCGEGGELELCLYEVEADRVTRLTQTDNMQEAVPVFSRDGRRLSFSREREGTWYLSTMDLATGEVRELVALTIPYACASTWSPEGDRIVFDMLNEAGDHDLFSVALDGSDLRRFVGGPGSQRFPRYSPDGRRLAWVDIVDGVGDIVVARADGSEPRKVVSHPADDGLPSWAPDGREMSFYSRRTGSFEIFTSDLAGHERQWTDSPASFDIFARYSPDGRWLVFESTRSREPGNFDRGADLFRIDRESGEILRLTEPADFPSSVDRAALGWGGSSTGE